MSAPSSMPQPGDPYQKATFPFMDRAKRLFWNSFWIIFFRFTPRPMFGWRRFVLRAFGAKVGPGCHIYPSARIWAPWYLELGEASCLADDVEVYNPGGLVVEHHSIVSQAAYLCGATHDVHHPAFTYVAKQIRLGAYTWIAARAVVLPGVIAGEGAVLAAGAVAPKNLKPWTIYAGNPAREVGKRRRGES